jgi:hypothetical protein
MKKTNFDSYLERQLDNPNFAPRFHQAGEEWDVALRSAARRNKDRRSQADFGRKNSALPGAKGRE